MTLKTFGHGDPRLPAALVALHDAAVAAGQPMYLDPDLGLWVQTSETLSRNGRCCGKCCRHCPFDGAEQRAAGRPVVRVESGPAATSIAQSEPPSEG